MNSTVINCTAYCSNRIKTDYVIIMKHTTLQMNNSI